MGTLLSALVLVLAVLVLALGVASGILLIAMLRAAFSQHPEEP